MSNLNMNPQEGRLVQANDVPVANSFGNRVERPLETAKVQRGTFGDFTGEFELAKAEGQAAAQVANMVQDTTQRMVNLKLAEEDTKRQLYEIDLQTKEKEARQVARQKAIDDGLDTDAEQQVYLDERGKRVGELKNKYTFVTKVGNDIEQRTQLMMERADVNYDHEVIEPRRVEKVKAGAIQALESWSKSLSDAAATETDAGKLAAAIKESKDAVYNYMRSPQMIAVFGAEAAEKFANKYVSSMQVDSITSFAERDPEQAVKLLRAVTGDPSTDPLYEVDPSIRRQLRYQAEREVSNRQAEAKAALKERQDKREAELSLDIVTGKIRGMPGINSLKKAWDDGEIDQSHFERGITKLQAEEDRRERRAQAAAERQARLREKYEILISPARDAYESGVSLDPKNPSHVKSVNALTEALLTKYPNEDRVRIMADVTAKTGIAPRVLTSFVHSKVNSKDATEVLQGTQLLAFVAEKAPNVIHSLNDEDVSIANQVSMGVSPSQAQANIERVRTLTKDQKDEYKKLASNSYSKLEPALKDAFGVRRKEITPEAYGHAKELFHDQLILTGGNVDAALESTKAIVKRTYNVSYLTGKPTLMANAPEGLNGKQDWMNKQFADDLKPFGIKPDQVRLKSNANGSYDIFVMNQQGAISGHLTDPKTGARLTWEPDRESVVKAMREKELQEAKRKRERYLSGEGSVTFDDLSAQMY